MIVTTRLLTMARRRRRIAADAAQLFGWDTAPGAPIHARPATDKAIDKETRNP